MKIYQDDNKMEIFTKIEDFFEETGTAPSQFFCSVKKFCFENKYITENQYQCLVSMLNKFRKFG